MGCLEGRQSLFNHKASVDLDWSNGQLSDQKFKKLLLKLRLGSEKFEINSLNLESEKGVVSVNGSLSFDGTGHLFVESSQFDIYQLIQSRLDEEIAKGITLNVDNLLINSTFSQFKSFNTLPKKFQSTVSLEISDASIFNQKLSFASIRSELTESSVKLKSFKVKQNASMLSGYIDSIDKNSVSIVLKNGSIIRPQDIEPVYNPLSDWMGYFNVDGNIDISFDSKVATLKQFKLNLEGSDINSSISELDSVYVSIKGDDNSISIDKFLLLLGKQKIIGESKNVVLCQWCIFNGSFIKV